MKFTWTENHMEADLEYGKLIISENEGEGFLPEQLFVSSIVGCSTYFFHTILEKQRINYKYLNVKTKIERNKDVNNKIAKITLEFVIEGNNLDERKLLKNLKLSRKYCGMVQSVKNSIEIEDILTIKT